VGRLLLAALLLLAPTRALAEQCKQTVLVREPCLGYRVPSSVIDAAIVLGEAAKEVGCTGPGAPQCIVALEAARQHTEAELVERTTQRDAEKKRGDRLDARLAEVSTQPERPWHEHPAFVAIAAAVAVGLAAVAVWQIAEAI
jgi:hypothetical protein